MLSASSLSTDGMVVTYYSRVDPGPKAEQTTSPFGDVRRKIVPVNPDTDLMGHHCRSLPYDPESFDLIHLRFSWL